MHHERLKLTVDEREKLRVDFWATMCRGHGMGPWHWYNLANMYDRKACENEES